MSDTIQVRGSISDLTTEAVMADVRAVISGDMGQRITAQSARLIASWWQSPGKVGHVLASFASGCAVSRAGLIKDILASRSETTLASDHDELDALLAFVHAYGRQDQ